MRPIHLALPISLALALGLAPRLVRAASPMLYVALGDSTAVGVGADRGGGYPDRLARRLDASGMPVRLRNLGTAGATAADVRHAQAPKLLGEHPALITIGIGLNDVLAGRPLSEFARDLEVLADAVGRVKAPVVISELPDLSESPSAQGSPRALARRIAAFNATIRIVAERHGFVVADFEAASRKAFHDRGDLLSPDGVHPSGSGYELWAEAIWPAVERALAPHVQARKPGSPSGQ